MEEIEEWLRHKIRIIVLKQWKRPRTTYRNLAHLNRKYKCGFSHEDSYKVANAYFGWYKRSGMSVVNYIISPSVHENKIKDGIAQ